MKKNNAFSLEDIEVAYSRFINSLTDIFLAMDSLKRPFRVKALSIAIIYDNG